MIATASKITLETRLAELVMTALDPCDLGDGIEVVHDVEAIEIEMECDLADVAPVDDVANTIKFAREPSADDVGTHDVGTHEFVRFSAPYERIEIQLDGNAFLRATIEEARRRSSE